MRVERVIDKMLKSVDLCFDALSLIVLVECVDTKPAWYGGRVDIDIVDKQRPTERKYLDDN